MIITKKVIKVCQSLGIIIDKPYLKILKIRHGDLVEVHIKKLERGR